MRGCLVQSNHVSITAAIFFLVACPANPSPGSPEPARLVDGFDADSTICQADVPVLREPQDLPRELPFVAHVLGAEWRRDELNRDRSLAKQGGGYMGAAVACCYRELVNQIGVVEHIAAGAGARMLVNGVPSSKFETRAHILKTNSYTSRLLNSTVEPQPSLGSVRGPVYADSGHPGEPEFSGEGGSRRFRHQGGIQICKEQEPGDNSENDTINSKCIRQFFTVFFAAAAGGWVTLQILAYLFRRR